MMNWTLTRRKIERKKREEVCALCEQQKASHLTKSPCGKADIWVCGRCLTDILRDRYAWQAWDDWLAAGGRGTILEEKGGHHGG
jgi:hypothetical protein